MKFSKIEIGVVFLAALFVAFGLGWFAGQNRNVDQPYQVVVEKSETPSPTATPVAETGILEGELININTASAEDLDRLAGIGPQRAQDIIDYRTKNGPFTTKEELMDVSGIGEATLDKVIDDITVE